MQNVRNVQMGLILILKVQLLVFLVQQEHFQIKLGLHVYNVLQAIFLILKTQQNVLNVLKALIQILQELLHAKIVQ